MNVVPMRLGTQGMQNVWEEHTCGQTDVVPTHLLTRVLAANGGESTCGGTRQTGFQLDEAEFEDGWTTGLQIWELWVRRLRLFS